MPIETSLIVITLDRPALLAEALESVTAQTAPPDEVIVVDNGPSEETAAVAARYSARLPLRCVCEPRRGYGPARNRGVREARGRIVLFLDDDCIAEPDWAARLRAPIERGEADVTGGSRVCGRPGLAARLDYLSSDGPVLHPRLPRRAVTHLSTSTLALRREVLDRVGPFAADLAMCEDRDFCARARLLGFRLLYEPAARVRHQPPIFGLAEYFRKMRHYGHGTSQYFLRWRKQEPLARMFPRRPALRLLLLPPLAAVGTAYLVFRNLPYRLDALPLAPLLFAGQLFWHWGGYLAARNEQRCSTAKSSASAAN